MQPNRMVGTLKRNSIASLYFYNTYSLRVTFSLPGCIRRPASIKVGPHQAKAPVTNATHVKPAVDNMNDGFLEISAMKSIELNHGLLQRIFISTNPSNPLCMMCSPNCENLRFDREPVLWSRIVTLQQ